MSDPIAQDAGMNWNPQSLDGYTTTEIARGIWEARETAPHWPLSIWIRQE